MISEANQKMKKQFERLQPILDFVSSFDEPEGLEHFLNLWKNADGIRFPPDEGMFTVVDLPENFQRKVERIAKETGRKKNDIINKLIDEGSKISWKEES